MFLPSPERLPWCWKSLSLLRCDFYAMVKPNEQGPPRSVSSSSLCECFSSGASSLKGLTHLSLLNVGLLSANLVNMSHPPLAMLSQKDGVYLLDSLVPHGHERWCPCNACGAGGGSSALLCGRERGWQRAEC